MGKKRKRCPRPDSDDEIEVRDLKNNLVSKYGKNGKINPAYTRIKKDLLRQREHAVQAPSSLRCIALPLSRLLLVD